MTQIQSGVSLSQSIIEQPFNDDRLRINRTYIGCGSKGNADLIMAMQAQLAGITVKTLAVFEPEEPLQELDLSPMLLLNAALCIEGLVIVPDEKRQATANRLSAAARGLVGAIGALTARERQLTDALDTIAFDKTSELSGNPSLWPSTVAYLALGGVIEQGARLRSREEVLPGLLAKCTSLAPSSRCAEDAPTKVLIGPGIGGFSLHRDVVGQLFALQPELFHEPFDIAEFCGAQEKRLPAEIETDMPHSHVSDSKIYFLMEVPELQSNPWLIAKFEKDGCASLTARGGSNLKIVEVPSGVSWYLRVEDDGSESVHEEHRIWR